MRFKQPVGQPQEIDQDQQPSDARISNPYNEPVKRHDEDDESRKLLQDVPETPDTQTRQTQGGEAADEDLELEKEPAHINTDKLADETKIEKLQRILCYFMIVFGVTGGLMSLLATSTTILEEIEADLD